MSLYDDASLIITPNSYKESKLYSIKPTDGSGDLDVVRATTATRVNSDGLIESVGVNIPRLDYSNGCPSILVEPQRTNLVFPSATATTQSRLVTATAHTLSFYGTGSVTLSGVATGTLNGTGANNRVTLTFTPTAGSLTLTVVGSVTNWQLEEGSNATSYIPTVASAVTRNADVISKTGISDLIGQTEGTLYADLFSEFSSQSKDFSVSDQTLDNRITLGYLNISETRFSIQVVKNGTLQVNNSFININQNIRNKIAFSYKENYFRLFINGILIFTDNLGETFNAGVLNTFLFNRANGQNPYTGEINLLALFKTALTDQQCIDLTTL